MSYSPGVQDQSGQLLAQGIGNFGDSLQKGMQTYQQNKTMASQAIGKFEATLQANPDLLAFLNSEQPSPNAPPEAVKAFMKLQKDGSLGLKDAAMLGQFADTYSKAKEDKQRGDLQNQQMQLVQFQLKEAQDKKAEEDAANMRMQQFARLGQSLQGGVSPTPPAMGGPAAIQSSVYAPNGAAMGAPNGPMSLGTSAALTGAGGNMNGRGVVRPEVSDAAQEFIKSGAGQLASQGVKMSTQQMVDLEKLRQQSMSAQERASMAAQSRSEVQGLRNEMGAQLQTARADAAAAKEDAKAALATKKDSATAFEETKKLRDEFSAHPNTKQFDVVDNYFSRGVNLAKKETAAGDMGLIFSLMKVYDPSSTVREGEYATASNSGSIPEQFLNIYNKAKDGQKLQPEQRAQFIDTMAEAADVQHKKLLGTAAQYAAIAKKRGLDPEEVIAPSYTNWKPPIVSEAAAPVVAPVKILSIKRVN